MLNNTDVIFEEQFNTNSNNYNDLEENIYKYEMKLYLDEFILQWYRYLEKVCRNSGKYNKVDWEDLFQDTIIEIYKIGARYNPSKGSIKSFILGSVTKFITRKDIIKRYKIKDSKEELLQFIEDIKCEVVAIDKVSTYDMLSELAPQERQVIEWKMVDGLTNKQIGVLLGIAEATVRYHIKRILDKLHVKGSGK